MSQAAQAGVAMRVLKMADSIRTEQLRTEAAKLQLQQKHERDLREMRDKNRSELQRVIDHHANVKTDLERAYEVALSVNQDEHEKKLNQIRGNNEKMIEEEKMRGEEEVERIRGRYAEQISRYKENAEKQLADMRRETERSAETIKRTRERAAAKGQA